MNQTSRIGDILIALGALTEAQAGQAAAHGVARPTRFASKCLELGLAGEQALVRGLAFQRGVPGVDLSQSVVDLAAVDLVPEPVATEGGFLPMGLDGDHMFVAVINPEDRQLLDELGFISGKTVVPLVALQTRLRDQLQAAYRAREAGESVLAGAMVPDGEASSPRVAEVDATAPETLASHDEPDEVLLEIEFEDVPEDDEPLEAPKPAPAPVVAPDAPKILVVDDEEEIRNLLVTALLGGGYRVETAGRGFDALAKVKSYEPDAVILDAMLPEVHGFEICRKIRSSKRFGHVPVIMISALYRGWRYAQDIQEVYGATDFLEKPFRLPEVLQRLRNALDGVDGTAASIPVRERSHQAHKRGVGLLKAGKVEGAIEAFREGIAVDPFSSTLQFSLGRALHLRKDYYGAMYAYEKAVELQPDLFPALKSLAGLYVRKGFRRKAIETWERAIPVAKTDEERTLAKTSLLELLDPATPMAAVDDDDPLEG